jgi:hypothetical protein
MSYMPTCDTTHFRLVERGQNHQKRLLLRRLLAQRKHLAAAHGQRRMARGGRPQDLRELALQRRNTRELVENTAGVSVLRIAPSLHLLVVAVFKPAVVINDGHALVGVHHRLFRGRGRRGEGQGGKRNNDG